MALSPAISLNLHGLTLTFQSPESALQDRFRAVYGHLSPSRRLDLDGGIVVNWTLSNEAMAPLPPAGVPVLAEDNLVSYYGDAQQVIIRMPKYGLLAVDMAGEYITGSVTQNCLDVYGAFEDVMMISLAPLYRRRGWFPLHAFAALAPNGQGALITGTMGSGKTTTGLALLSAGWKLLSNDSPLLRLRQDGVDVLAYPGRLSAFDDSLARFERLRQFIPVEKSDAGEKRVFSPEEAFDKPWANTGRAGAVFFPQVVPGLAHSELVSAAQTEAIVQLVPQAIEGWDKAVIGQNLQLLSTLVEQVPCYYLRLCPHIEQLPDLILKGMLAA